MQWQAVQGFQKIFGAAALLLMLCSPSGSALAQDRDIMELYRLAKVIDPTVSRAEARLEGGKADKDIAFAALLPRISANASVRQFWTKVLNYNGKDQDGQYTGFSYGLGGLIPVFNMPSYYQLSAASYGINSAEFGINAARQDLIVRLFDAYVRYLKAKADEKLYRNELSRVGRALEQSEAFLNAGTGDIIAVYEAKARLDGAAAELIKNEGLVRVAQQNLASLTGIMPDSVREITSDSYMVLQPADLEWWVATMQQKNPAVLQAREDILQTEEYSRAANAGHYPVIQGNGGFTADKGSTFLPKVETDQWYLGIGINIPIYSGGETSARTRRALAGEAERRAILNDAQERAIRTLKETYLSLQYNISLVDAYKRKLDSSELQLKAVQKGRDIGTRTVIDLLNSEQNYAISRRDLTNARYDVILRQIQLKAAAGILSEDDLQTVNNSL
jgi:outer membrane protein